MAEIFLLSPLFVDYLLPFVFVFTLIFAILQKTKLLGDESRQINAIIGFVCGMMLIAFPSARSIVVLLTPFLAVFAVILLVFMLLYGFVFGKKEGDVLDRWWKIGFAGILFIALAVYLLIITDWWNSVLSVIFDRSGISTTLITIAVVIGVIVAVIVGQKKS